MRLGIHIATGGNLAGAPARARDIGADTIQIFASNPRGWRPTIHAPETARAFRDACQEYGTLPVFIHMIYLTGYGTANDEIRQKSIAAMKTMLRTSDLLGCQGVITHLGSHSGITLEEGLERTIAALAEVLQTDASSQLILENSAGAGSIIGDTVDELSVIISGLGDSRVRVCLDTAHLLASGHEIRSEQAWGKLLEEFDQKIGLEKLAVMHLNDSKIDLGKKADRHENIGDGFIGADGFRAIINHPGVKDLPGILEVPGLDGKGPDSENLARLRRLIA